MRRLICKNAFNCEIGEVIKICDTEAHHLSSVLKKKPGEQIEILIFKDKLAYLTKILSKNELKLTKQLAKTDKRKIELAVAFIKPALCELIVEKASEIGVSSVCFFQAERSKLKAENFEKKLTRLSKIRDSALKQSKSTISTEIKAFTSLQSYISKYLESQLKPPYKTDKKPTGIILNPKSSNSITELKKSKEYDDLYLIVGPEGGLTEDEFKLARSLNAVEVNIGSTILRTETAAILSSALFLID